MDQFGLAAVKAWNAQPRHQYQHIAVKPITHTIGAEVSGIEIGAGVSAEQLAEVQIALRENLLLVFRDQHMSQEQHKEFGKNWGKLHLHPVYLAEGRPNPEVIYIKSDSTSLHAIGEGWHTDSTLEECPPMGSMLYMKEMPEGGFGGDTSFANMYLAYETLSPPMREFLDGLTAIHDGRNLVKIYNFKEPEGGYPSTRHPLIVRHPDTGRKLLYVSPSFTHSIPELGDRESQVLLDMLFRHVEASAALVCRVRWEVNTMVFWDNRCTQHCAIWDYAPFTRLAERVTILGDRPQA